MNDPKDFGKIFSNFSLSFLNLGTTTSEQHLSLAASGFQKQTKKKKKKKNSTKQNTQHLLCNTKCNIQMLKHKKNVYRQIKNYMFSFIHL